MAITINRSGTCPTASDINFDAWADIDDAYVLSARSVAAMLTTMTCAEFLSHVSSALDVHQFVQLSLEDPKSDRKTLYKELAQILESRLT